MMSETSRNKNVILSTPYLFQRDLFDCFCLETRINFRNCSKRCQKLVDNMPLTFETFDITVCLYVYFEYPEAAFGTLDKVSYRELDEGRIYRRHESGKEVCQRVERGCFAKKTAEQLGAIFSLPSLKINKMTIRDWESFSRHLTPSDRGNDNHLFFLELKPILSALPHYLQVQKVEFFGDMQYEQHLSIIPYLKPGMLKSIRMGDIGSDGSFNQILNMEQVQQARSFKLNSYRDSFPFHTSLRNQEISVRLKNFSESDLNRLIQDSLNYETVEKAVIRNIGIQNEEWMKKYVSKNQAEQGNDGIAIVKGPRFEYEVVVEESLVTIKRKFD